MIMYGAKTRASIMVIGYNDTIILYQSLSHCNYNERKFHLIVHTTQRTKIMLHVAYMRTPYYDQGNVLWCDLLNLNIVYGALLHGEHRLLFKIVVNTVLSISNRVKFRDKISTSVFTKCYNANLRAPRYYGTVLLTTDNGGRVSSHRRCRRSNGWSEVACLVYTPYTRWSSRRLLRRSQHTR